MNLAAKLFWLMLLIAITIPNVGMGQVQMNVFNDTLVIIGGDDRDHIGIGNFDNDASKIKILDYVTSPATVYEFVGISNVLVDLGDGNNTVLSYPFAQSTEPDTILGELIILTGDDDDNISIAGLTVHENVEVRAGNGDNEVEMGHCLLMSDFLLEFGSGEDMVNFPGIGYETAYGEVLGNFTVEMGGGVDRFKLTSFTCGGNFDLDSGPGLDWIWIEASTYLYRNDFQGDFTVDSGSGNDVIDILELDVAGNLDIQTKSGWDNIDFDRANPQSTVGVTVLGTTLIDTGNQADTIELANSIFSRNVTIRTGHGTDDVFLTNNDHIRRLSIDLGIGSDDLEIDGCTAQSSSLYGGGGYDYGNKTNSPIGNGKFFFVWAFETGNLAN